VFGVSRTIRGIRALKAGRLTVSADPAIEVTLDGELCGPLSGVFEVVPKGLRVIAPDYPNSTAR
jgi:diacylglycerol kinase family enzyme